MLHNVSEQTGRQMENICTPLSGGARYEFKIFPTLRFADSHKTHQQNFTQLSEGSLAVTWRNENPIPYTGV